MKSVLYDTVVAVSSLKSADNETLTGATIDMKGFDGVAFIAVALKGEALDFAIKAQQGAASNMSDAADLAGTSVAFSTAVGTDGLTTLEVLQPRERYVRAVVTVPNATSATPTSVIAIKFKAKNLPQSNSGEQHIGPAEGTA